jgi:DNA-binding MarR family transcriptional regulator
MPISTLHAVTPRWLEGDEVVAWRGMLRVTSHLVATLDTELATFGLTLAEYEVLSHLAAAEGHRLRMTELAARSLVSRSGLTRRIDGLERRGLVRRETCDNDRRGANAVLTPAGEDLHLQAAPSHVESVRRHFLDQLSTEQVSALAEAFSGVGPSDDAAITALASPTAAAAVGRLASPASASAPASASVAASTSAPATVGTAAGSAHN